MINNLQVFRALPRYLFEISQEDLLQLDFIGKK